MPLALIALGSLFLGHGWSPVAGVPGFAEAGRGKNRYTPHPPVKEIAEGVYWPEGQALPIFATPAATLDTIEVQALSIDEQITFSALQGQVNRKKPRIYLVDARSDEGRDTWANTATVALGPRNTYGRESKYDLAAKYAGEIKGAVLYDPRPSPHFRNLAGTVAGLYRALPVTAEVLQRLRARGVRLPVLADLTTLKLSSPIEIYEHLHGRYWKKCEKRLIVSARPDDRGGDHHHTRDIAAACGAAVVWLDNRVPAERAVMRKFLGDMKAGASVVLGWYSTERSGITTASEFGIGTLPADFFISATVYSGTDHRIRIPEVPKKPPLEDRVYVAIFVSDGDNIQYVQRAMRKIWDRSAGSRGKVALNWTVAPGLVDIAPGILNYYYATATRNDCFVAGPSGMGYMMPVNTLEEPGAPVGPQLRDRGRMDRYARLTETYLERSGLRVVTIWDDATPTQREAYAEHCRSLYGATVQNFKDVPSVKGSVVGERVRFDRLVIPYVGTLTHLRSSLERELGRWDGKSPVFLGYQVSIWGEMKPDRIVEFVRGVNERFPDTVRFVRADHYFNLYNEAHGLPFNLVLSPSTKVEAGDPSGSPELATDGTPSSLWISSGSGPRWLRFDFGGSCRITRYLIRHAGASGMKRDLNTRDFTVQASADGESWKTIATVRGNREDVTDVDLDPVSARYLKITVDDPGGDSTARIAEVEIFGNRVGA
ncbi:MAG: discoidin domain-containing protein [Planctomycetes bacterium]|nr:discoidin domain-containing protein [Planctomycetota bacterium]